MKVCGMGKAEVAMAIGHMCRLNHEFMPSGFVVTSFLRTHRRGFQVDPDLLSWTAEALSQIDVQHRLSHP